MPTEAASVKEVFFASNSRNVLSNHKANYFIIKKFYCSTRFGHFNSISERDYQLEYSINILL